MTIATQNDIDVLRRLAERYAEIAALPIQDERRRLWTASNSLRPTRPLVMATFGMWNVWCREVFGDHAMACVDPFYRGHERALRMAIFQYETGDDCIQEPWITQGASVAGGWRQLWGVNEDMRHSDMEGGAGAYDPPMKSYDDLAKLTVTQHQVDWDDTHRNVERLQQAVGDLIEIDQPVGCAYHAFMADISTSLAGLRGLEQVMEDMYDDPEALHRLLAFMRDGILQTQQEAEDAGAYSLTTQVNQAQTYADELEPPRANSGPRKRKALWAHCAAQEFTLISPAMHDEFLLHYQLPIISNWGLVAYGCCENLTRKIDMLRQIPNLRQIAVTPTADIAACAEQIKADYVLNWRPNPTDHVCCGFDEAKIRGILRHAMSVTKGNIVQIHLKDVETVEGDPSRMRRWVEIVREETS